MFEFKVQDEILEKENNLIVLESSMNNLDKLFFMIPFLRILQNHLFLI